MKKSRKADPGFTRESTSFSTVPPGRSTSGASSDYEVVTGSWLSVAFGTLVGFALVTAVVTLGVMFTTWALRSSEIIDLSLSVSQSVVVACLIVAWKVAGLSFGSAIRR